MVRQNSKIKRAHSYKKVKRKSQVNMSKINNSIIIVAITLALLAINFVSGKFMC